MSDTFVAYDTQTGRILGVHHGPTDPEYRWKPKLDPSLQCAILRGAFPALSRGKHYAVDTKYKRLVEVTAQQGIGFGFGKAGGMSKQS